MPCLCTAQSSRFRHQLSRGAKSPCSVVPQSQRQASDENPEAQIWSIWVAETKSGRKGTGQLVGERPGVPSSALPERQEKDGLISMPCWAPAQAVPQMGYTEKGHLVAVGGREKTLSGHPATQLWSPALKGLILPPSSQAMHYYVI